MKYPVEVRLAAVKHYLAGKATLKETARQFKVGKSPLNRWIRAYRHQGMEGLKPRSRHPYTAEFKLCVVRYIIRNRCSCEDASAHFAIPNETCVLNWLKRYQLNGSRAFKPAKTARIITSGVAMKKAKSPPNLREFSEMTHAELQDELEYLRAENAYLKKLKSLREEELREQQKKRQQ